MINKKGSLPLELILVVVVLFGFGLIAFLAKDIMTDVNTEIQADASISADAKTQSANMTTRIPTIFDAGFILIFILLWIAVLVFGYQIDTYPIYFIVALILLVISIGIALAIESSYTDLLEDDTFSSMPNDFPLTNFILSRLGLVITIMGASLLIVLYGKIRQ